MDLHQPNTGVSATFSLKRNLGFEALSLRNSCSGAKSLTKDDPQKTKWWPKWPHHLKQLLGFKRSCSCCQGSSLQEVCHLASPRLTCGGCFLCHTRVPSIAVTSLETGNMTPLVMKNPQESARMFCQSESQGGFNHRWTKGALTSWSPQCPSHEIRWQIVFLILWSLGHAANIGGPERLWDPVGWLLALWSNLINLSPSC